MRARKTFQVRGLRCVGIDEAGLGPILGPFCAAAVHLDGADEIVDLPPNWQRAFFAPTPALEVADSKVIFRGPYGRARGEAVALAALLPADSPANQLFFDAAALFERVGLSAERCSAAAPWYRGMNAPLPRWASPQAIAAAHAEFGAVPAGALVRWHRAEVRWIPEHDFNQALRRFDNKADATWESVGGLLHAALSDPHPSGFVVRIDRQGGRRFYAERLRELLPHWSLEDAQESRASATYTLRERRGRRRASITIEARAEQRSFAVALASILAKYFRELAMDSFNAWFQGRVPHVRPTAGYPEDGRRWLDEMSPHFGDLKISAEELRRQR